MRRRPARPLDSLRQSPGTEYAPPGSPKLYTVPSFYAAFLTGSSHCPENDSSLKGDVWMGDSLGSLNLIKPKPVAS
jgi:hypothetical protein